nr:PqqD family protein [Acidobacteriota bacterium]
MSQNPIARKAGLVLQEMPDELLVYDLDTNKAHCLNQTSAFVWKACNGKNTVGDISRLFGTDAGNSVPEDLVWLAIDQLSQNNLLENKISPKLNGQTRREVIKKIGLASVIALPLVASLAAPSSVLAVVSCPTVVCQTNADCGPCVCTGAGGSCVATG